MNHERPACFGSAVAVSQFSPTCQVCRHALGCVDGAGRLLQEQQGTPLIRAERMRLSAAREALASAPGRGDVPMPASTARRAFDGLSAQVSSVAKRLHEKGWFDFARAELSAGRNPGNKDWQRVLCDALLAGGTTRAQLQLAFQQSLQMTPGSAKVRASKGIAIFAAGGLVIERDSVLMLRRN